MNYVKINNGLYLLEQPVAKTNKKVTSQLTNHIWIYDRSWSMSYELPQLCRDLITRAKKIPTGDTITLGWFSGEGQFNFILKGFKVTEKADYRSLEQAINNNSRPVSCTCFSEILGATDRVIKDLSIFSHNFAFCFFTDGYPVVHNYSREIKAIKDAIAVISGRITSGLFVGYGNYYNKELMADMAERMGASLTHNGNLEEFNVALEGFIEDARDNDGKIAVKLETNVTENDLIFGINGRQINVYKAEENKIGFIPVRRGASNVYILTNHLPRGFHTAVAISENELSRPTKKSPTIAALYAAAFVLTQRTKADIALEVLGHLGDKYLIDQVSNSYTNEEYGKTEAAIRRAAVRPKNNRIKHGYDANYLPKEDAFCLLDVLNILMADKNAKFYPYHEDFYYKRIGGTTAPKEGYPQFDPNLNSSCYLNTLTWNKTKLNLSVLAKISGTIPLNKGYAEHGFQKDYPTWVFRNYALVKDGFLNAPKLPVTISEESFNRLLDEGLINSCTGYFSDKIYSLHLDRVPVINRGIAKGNTSAKALCQKVEEEMELQAKLKVLGTKLKEVDPGVVIDSTLTEDQRAFLTENGIGNNGFAPPVKKLESVDSYIAKEFKIQAKGFSALPKISEVEGKVNANKKLRPVDTLMKSAIDAIGDEIPLIKSQKAFVTFLKDLIDDYRSDLVKVRNGIQATKFAIILGKKWFDEFDSRENNSLEVNGKTFTIGVKEVEVKI